MNERIKKLRKSLNMTQSEFSSRINLSRNFIAQIETGASSPSERTLKDICREFHISYEWLTQGIEPMQEPTDDYTQTRIDNIMTGENNFAKNLFKEFSKLEKEEWELLEKIIKNISKEL